MGKAVNMPKTKGTAVKSIAVEGKNKGGKKNMFNSKSKLAASIEAANAAKAVEVEKNAAEEKKAELLREQRSHLDDEKDTMISIAKQVEKTGYPVTINLGNGGVTISDAADYANFERAVYANLSESALKKIENGELLNQYDVSEALMVHHRKAALGNAMVEAGLKADKEIVVDNIHYLLTKDSKILDIDQNVVADVSNLDKSDPISYGINLADTIRNAIKVEDEDGDNEECDESEEDDEGHYSDGYQDGSDDFCAGWDDAVEDFNNGNKFDSYHHDGWDTNDYADGYDAGWEWMVENN